MRCQNFNVPIALGLTVMLEKVAQGPSLPFPNLSNFLSQNRKQSFCAHTAVEMGSTIPSSQQSAGAEVLYLLCRSLRWFLQTLLIRELGSESHHMVIIGTGEACGQDMCNSHFPLDHTQPPLVYCGGWTGKIIDSPSGANI